MKAKNVRLADSKQYNKWFDSLTDEERQTWHNLHEYFWFLSCGSELNPNFKKKMEKEGYHMLLDLLRSALKIPCKSEKVEFS